MSGRKSKRTQKLGSSRRNRNNRDTEERDNDDGLPQYVNEEHKSEHSNIYPVSENPPAVAHQTEVAYIDQPTSASELPPHLQLHDCQDLVTPAEMASRRKMGSSRKSRGFKIKGVSEQDPEHRPEAGEVIGDEAAEEVTIKEVENKEDNSQPGLSGCPDSQSMYHESYIRQEADLALGNITDIKDDPGNDEHLDTHSYELDQSKEMALEQELMKQTHDFGLLTPTHLPPHKCEDSLEIYNQTETFCEQVIPYTDQGNKTNQTQGLLSASQEERPDVHTILNTKHVQSNLNLMGEDKQLEATATLHFREQDDATVVPTVKEQQHQDLNAHERGLKDEAKLAQKDREEDTVTGHKCSTNDYDHIDNSLKLKDDTEKQTEELGPIYENTEYNESVNKNMEVCVVGNITDSEVHDQVVDATYLKQTEVLNANIILSPELTNPEEQPSLEKYLPHELDCEKADSEFIHHIEDEVEFEVRHFIPESSAEEDRANQDDYLKEPGNEEACKETKEAEQETRDDTRVNNLMDSNDSYPFLLSKMSPSIANEINSAASLCEEMQTDNVLQNDSGDSPTELNMHPKNKVAADLPPDSCQLPEDKPSQYSTFCNVGPLQLNDSTLNQDNEKEKYTPDDMSEAILEQIESPENLYDAIVFSRGEQETTGDKIMSEEPAELKITGAGSLTRWTEQKMLLVSHNEDTNTESLQQEEGNVMKSADQLFSTEGLERNALCIEEDVKHESYRNQKSEGADVLQTRGDRIAHVDEDTEITHQNYSQIYSTAVENNTSQTFEIEGHCSEVSSAVVTPLTPTLTDVHISCDSHSSQTRDSISYKDFHNMNSFYNLPSDSVKEDEQSTCTNNLPVSTTLFVCDKSEMTEVLTTTQTHEELDREDDDTVVIRNKCTRADATLAIASDVAEHLDTEVHNIERKTELTERVIQTEGSIWEGQEDSDDMYKMERYVPLIHCSDILRTEDMVPEKENLNLKQVPNAGPTENITMEDFIMECSQQHIHSEWSTQPTEEGLSANTVQSPEKAYSDSKKDESMSSENGEKKDEEHELARHQTKKKRFGSTRRIQGTRQGHAEGQGRDCVEEDSKGDAFKNIDPTSTLNFLTVSEKDMCDVSCDVQVPTLKENDMVESNNETEECGRVETPPMLSNVVFETFDTVTFDKVNNADGLVEPIGQDGKPDVHVARHAEITYINKKDIRPLIGDASTDHVSTEAKEYCMETAENESTSQIQSNSPYIPEELSPETQNSLMSEYKENIEDRLEEPDLASKQPVVQMQQSNYAQDNVITENSGFSISRQRRKMGSTRKSLRGKITEGDQTDTFEAVNEKENTHKATKIRSLDSEEDCSVAETLSIIPESNQSIEGNFETSGSLSSMQSKAEMGLRNANNTEILQENNLTSPTLFVSDENKTELTTTLNDGKFDKEDDDTVVIRNVYEGINVALAASSNVAEQVDTEVHSNQSKMKSAESLIQTEEFETEHSGSKEDNGTSSENVIKHDVKLPAQIQTKKKKFGSTRRVQRRHQGFTEGKEREQEDTEDAEGDEREIVDPTSTSNLPAKPHDAVTCDAVSFGVQGPTLTMEQKQLIESKDERDECEIVHSSHILTNVGHETETVAFEVNDAEGFGEPGKYRKPGVDDARDVEFACTIKQQMLPVFTEDHESTEAKQHCMESTGNKSTIQVNIHSTCIPMKISLGTQDNSVLEVYKENTDAGLFDKYHIVPKDHLQPLLHRELEPVQVESTVPTPESKSDQDTVTSISRPRRKMGSARKSLRGKIPDDNQTDTFVIKEKENIQEQTTEHCTSVSENKYSEAETPSIIPETSHQTTERHSEPSVSARHPETAEAINREDIKSATTESANTVSVFHEIANRPGSEESQIDDKLVEDSLLSEIASELKRSYQSPLITTDPNVHLSADSTPNCPLETSANQPNIPDISECEQHKDILQLSPSRRKRKMGSTRKIGRNMPEQTNNYSEETEKGTEDMDMSKKDKDSQNERENGAIVTEHIKGSAQPSSDAQAASQVLESNTSEKGHPLPAGKKKFGSRRTAKDRGGVGALTSGNYDTIQRTTEAKAPNSDLLVCDPYISDPGSLSASQHGGIEASPGIEEVIKPIVKATDSPTATGLVSLKDIRKSSPSAGSTRERLKLDHEQWNEPIPDFGQAVYNVVMVGNSNVGKTSFIRRLQNGHFNTDYCATIGVDTFVQTVTLGNKTVKLYVWDTAGQERYHSITRQVFHKAQGLLLMYDITSSQSFHAVRDWIYQVQEKAPDDVIMMLLGNKNDCDMREVQLKEGEDLSKEFDIHFMECSAATGENVSECMKTLAWLLVKQRVRKEEEHTVLQPKPQQTKSGCC